MNRNYKDPKVREQHREYQRKWRKRNAKKHFLIKKKSEAKRKLYAMKYKASRGCKYCGEKHPACLLFHHVRGKKIFNVSCCYHRCGLGKLKKEIKKCEIVCANCHAKLHWKMRGRSKLYV